MSELPATSLGMGAAPESIIAKYNRNHSADDGRFTDGAGSGKDEGGRAAGGSSNNSAGGAGRHRSGEGSKGAAKTEPGKHSAKRLTSGDPGYATNSAGKDHYIPGMPTQAELDTAAAAKIRDATPGGKAARARVDAANAKDKITERDRKASGYYDNARGRMKTPASERRRLGEGE